MVNACAAMYLGQTAAQDGGASPLYADGKVYFQSEDGIGVVVRAGKKFEILARNSVKEGNAGKFFTLASYGAADGAIFLRTAQHLQEAAA